MSDESSAASPVEKHIIIKFDGASRGNPGPAGIGVILENSRGEVVGKVVKRIGVATNNQAEYSALIAGIEAALRLGAVSLDIRGDSKLIVEQIRGNYKVKEPKLKSLFQTACRLLTRCEKYSIKWVPREANSEADKLIDNLFLTLG
ncbi:MAG: ribonuclease HI family protein [Dehalococcoidia bacterium]|nr:ribonuclease HI family protein [Dehalococcoidia bacterium]